MFAFIASGAIYANLALASLVDLISAIRRKRGLVITYSSFVWLHLVGQIVVGILLIYALFQKNSELVAQCKDRVSGREDS
jgi:hypothetical protein